MMLRLLLLALALACAAGAAAAQTLSSPPPVPGVIEVGSLIGADMNSTADQPISLLCPATACLMVDFTVTNPSGTLASATGTLFASPSATNPINPSGTTTSTWAGMTASTSAARVALCNYAAVVAGGSPQSSGTVCPNAYFTGSKTIYLHLGAGEGSAATVDLRVFAFPLN